MGFRSKRQAKKLPDLMEGLEFLRTAVATLGASGKLDEDQIAGMEVVAPKLDTMIEEGNAYLLEYRSEGDVSDPGFREWFSHAEGFFRRHGLSNEGAAQDARRGGSWAGLSHPSVPALTRRQASAGECSRRTQRSRGTRGP
jgi:hypothetical protein